MLQLRTSALLLWGAGLLACPAPTRPPLPGDAGTLLFVGRACNVDAECGELRCDKVRHQCICLSDESCKSSDPADPVRFCNNYTGLCVTEIVGCTKDGDCKDAQGNVDLTQYCDASIRACRPLKGFCEPCAADGECGGAEDNCLLDSKLGQKFCSKACSGVADCPRGAGCELIGGKKQCWPVPNPLSPTEVPSCKNFRGCTPDSLRTCNTNADCNDLGSQRCDTSKGKCVAIDQVCAFGTVCDPRSKICVAECTANEDCGDPKLRCTNRVCEPIGECTTDAQCPLNKVCSLVPGQSAGQCLPFCQSDAECPLGTVCQRGGDGRYRCAAGCSSNSSCPIEQRCSTAKSCEGPLVGTTRTCQATVGCAGCEMCNLTTFACYSAKGSYPHCSPCDPSANECTGGACVLMDDGKSYCAKYCGTGQECPQGFVCLPLSSGTQAACVPSDRQCTGKCP